MASLHDEVSGHVRLGVIGTTARWVVPPLLVAMTAQHPRVHLVVVDATTSSLLPQLVGGRLDLAIVNLPVEDPDIAIEQLFDEDPTLVTPLDHPLADHERVTLADIAAYPILLEPQGTNFRDVLDGQARAEGVTLDAPGRDRRHAPAGHARLPGLRCRPAAGQRRARTGWAATGAG